MNNSGADDRELPPGMAQTGKLIKTRVEYLPNAEWFAITVHRPAWVFFPATTGVIYYEPDTIPSGPGLPIDTGVDQALYLHAPGVWYVKQSSGAAIPVTVADGGNPYSPGASGVVGSLLYAPPVLLGTTGKAIACAAGDNDSTMGANTARRWLSAYNLGSANVAVCTKASALGSAVDGLIFVLGPGQGYKLQTPSEPPPTGPIRFYALAVGSTVYLAEGT